MRGQNQNHRLLDEFCALVFSMLRSSARPLPPAPAPARVRPPTSKRPRVSPAELASLLLGMSLALMLCGSVTFVIGFMLMPWVLGLVMVFYVAGVVSGLVVLGRSILCLAPASPESPRKELLGLPLPKLPITETESDMDYPNRHGAFWSQSFAGTHSKTNGVSDLM